jgi:branched-chain amino acid transport system substrate-binding protein
MLDQAEGYAKALAEVFEATFARGGGRVVGKERYTSRDRDFSSILARVAAARPDVVYLPGNTGTVNAATRQAKERGIKAPFIGGDAWGVPELDTRAAAGGYFTTHYSPDDPSPAVASFQKAFRGRFKDPGGAAAVPDALAALAYDATNLMLQAIENAGIDDPELVARALAAARLEGASGTFEGFDGDHNPIKSAVVLAVHERGVSLAARVRPR